MTNELVRTPFKSQHVTWTFDDTSVEVFATNEGDDAVLAHVGPDGELMAAATHDPLTDILTIARAVGYHHHEPRDGLIVLIDTDNHCRIIEAVDDVWPVGPFIDYIQSRCNKAIPESTITLPNRRMCVCGHRRYAHEMPANYGDPSMLACQNECDCRGFVWVDEVLPDSLRSRGAFDHFERIWRGEANGESERDLHDSTRYWSRIGHALSSGACKPRDVVGTGYARSVNTRALAVETISGNLARIRRSIETRGRDSETNQANVHAHLRSLTFRDA